MLFLAKSITVGGTDVRTEQKRRRFRIGTPALRRRLDGVGSAGHIRPKGPASGVAVMGQAKPMTAIVIASIRKAVKKMVKQRLIDGDELYGIESLLNTDIIQNSPEASWLMAQVLYDIQASPTIDPETLPIVRQLRAELARVTAERDAVYCLPVKPGDKVYQQNGVDVYELEVKKIIFDCGHIAFDESAIGSSIHLTEEAANAALAKSVKP